MSNRITNINTISALLDRLVTENIKLFFFEKDGKFMLADHQRTVIVKIKEELIELMTETYTESYQPLLEKRTFSQQFTDEVIQLVHNDIRIGEADRARQTSISGDEVNFYKLAFNEIRMRVSNEGRANNKNNIDTSFMGVTEK